MKTARFVRWVRPLAALAAGALVFQTGPCTIPTTDYYSYELLSLLRQIIVLGLGYTVVPQS